MIKRAIVMFNGVPIDYKIGLPVSEGRADVEKITLTTPGGSDWPLVYIDFKGGGRDTFINCPVILQE